MNVWIEEMCKTVFVYDETKVTVDVFDKWFVVYQLPGDIYKNSWLHMIEFHNCMESIYSVNKKSSKSKIAQQWK